MSIRTFYRWLGIMMDDIYPDRNLDFQLREISLKRFEILSYVLDSVKSPMLAYDSVELLPPGVYGPFNGDKPFRGPIGHVHAPGTFREIERDILERGGETAIEMTRENEMPQAVIDAVTARDGGVCCVTGRADLPASVIWVFPPSLADMSYPSRDSGDEDLFKAYRNVDNAITLCNMLVEPFMDNMVSVDTEDNNRIITFLDLPIRVPDAPPLPSHLPRPASLYWYYHFKWTLRAHFVGGDVSSDEVDPHPNTLMEELVEHYADIRDAKWQSGIGAEVLAEFLQQSKCLKNEDVVEESEEEWENDSEGVDVTWTDSE
ncbi:hypothetical protein C8R45DRAFT_1086127 [Mycena sanguinolenta]|nr:hypothetical protein C8R45DRAFT_1086127 [Mycena sanguinolenta]